MAHARRRFEEALTVLKKDFTKEQLKETTALLWSSFFVTLVAKKYRLATMLPFVPRMVCDSR